MKRKTPGCDKAVMENGDELLFFSNRFMMRARGNRLKQVEAHEGNSREVAPNCDRLGARAKQDHLRDFL